MEIKFFDLQLRTVNEEDAEFILELRTDDKRKRFISATDISIQNQKKWIDSYKSRESSKEEYYFIAKDNEGEDFGLYRVYKIESGLPEIGSWIIKPNYSKVSNTIKLDIGIKDFVLNKLNFNKLQFEVRKKNFSVYKYHQLFGAIQTNEDDLNYYFILTREKFNENKNKLLNKFKITAL